MIDQTVICTYVALCENMSALQLLVGPSEGMISGRLEHLKGWGPGDGWKADIPDCESSELLV